jgi:DNA mismatch repair ATPase MutS
MLNAVAGLDAHLWRGIVRWRARHGASAAGWIDAAAVVEAQVALATLGFEHPDWAMPVVHDDLERPPLRATALGHPLIESARCVRNDLVLARGGDLLVVSGSNMSGKTTYLRAAGLNALLAQAGGPVCAASFELRRCRVRTSVRVEDDLASGVSLFYAEARRLRDIVAAAREQDRPPVLFLLDEILHGTNAADRRRATQVVLSHLVRAGAFGMVTTHDPLIAPDAEANVRQVHFSEALSADDDAGLEFDYRIREGPATSANALAILRALGL